jgi:hypothetical protein
MYSNYLFDASKTKSIPVAIKGTTDSELTHCLSFPHKDRGMNE